MTIYGSQRNVLATRYCLFLCQHRMQKKRAVLFLSFDPWTYTQSHTVQGGKGGLMEPPSPGFLICCTISKAFDVLYKMRHILWVVALLEVCDVTKHGRHLGRHLGFYQE